MSFRSSEWSGKGYKLLVISAFHMRELQLLQWRLLQVDFDRENRAQVWKVWNYLSPKDCFDFSTETFLFCRKLKLFITTGQGLLWIFSIETFLLNNFSTHSFHLCICKNSVFFRKIQIVLISLVLILTPTHCMQWRLIIISDGSLQISGLQSNTFLTDLMTMVEGEVSNDYENCGNYENYENCEWQTRKGNKLLTTSQEGVVGNGTVRSGEEEPDVILCHKHEGE